MPVPTSNQGAESKRWLVPLLARCESEFSRSFTKHLHKHSAAHSRLDVEAPRDRNARQAIARAFVTMAA
jgi:hypothetical protein